MSDISRDEFNKLVSDLVLVKNDVNTIKANTQLTASVLSLQHSNNIIDYIFRIAKTERLCKALMLCKEPKTMRELCEALGIKLSNLRRDVLDKLLDSLLTTVDDGTKLLKFKRVAYFDAVGFDKKAVEMYPNLKEITR